ncbi:MAG: ubiquinol-cytochrome c reductase iron-sulfur subunit [Candidatus Binatia bacterium]
MEKPEHCSEKLDDLPQKTPHPTLSGVSRRTVLCAALGAGLALHLSERPATAQNDPKKSRPQAGDQLVFSTGDRKGQPITGTDLPVGGPPIVAYPVDPATHTIRDGSRLNRVLLVRLATNALTDQTRTAAADGIVGYSAVCTHTGCDVSGWQSDSQHFVCPCHTSTFNPKDRARVVSGPAPKPLAILPLQLVKGTVTVAGPFAGRVGAQQQ